MLPGPEDAEALETLDEWFGGLPTEAEAEEYDHRQALLREEAKVSSTERFFQSWFWAAFHTHT